MALQLLRRGAVQVRHDHVLAVVQLFGLLLQKFADPLTGAERALDLAVQLGERAHGAADEHGVKHEARQFAGAEAAVLDQVRPVPQHQHHAAEQREGNEGPERAPVARPAQNSGDKRLQTVPVAVQLVALIRERLDVQDALQ